MLKFHIFFLIIFLKTYAVISSHWDTNNSQRPVRTSYDLEKMKKDCYKAFFSEFNNTINVELPFDQAATLSPMGSHFCSDSASPCVSLESFASNENNTFDNETKTFKRLTPMQAQTQVTAYKPQQFIKKNLQKNPLSSMSPQTISDHWQLYEGFSYYYYCFYYYFNYYSSF